MSKEPGLKTANTKPPAPALTATLPAAVATTLIIALLFWLAVFGKTALSGNPDDWSSFGSYFGGVLSPIIAAFALIAFLHTINQQQILITQQQDQLNEQRRQGNKTDIVTALRLMEADYERELSTLALTVTSPDGSTQECTGLDVFSMRFPDLYVFAIPMREEYQAQLRAQGETGISRNAPGLQAFIAFGMAAGHLNHIRLYVAEHDQIAGNNAMGNYYRRKYKLAYERLTERGYLSTPWPPLDTAS